MLSIILYAIWLMLPAYIPNPSAALFGGGKPIDLGMHLRDGRRIFGDGKTYKGLITGTACGVIVGVIQMYVATEFELPIFSPEAIFCLAFGAMSGDLAASFFKRRVGLERGAMLPIVDQLDFVAGAWLLTFLFSMDWFLQNFSSAIVIAVLLITPILHVTVNRIGYILGKKDVPW
jgi:CDP-2,3-bis-(O-geranylgeranyl)-sn-glycerol synthase